MQYILGKNTPRELIKLEQFQNSCIRQIHDPGWYIRTEKISRKQLYQKYKQPMVETWMQKMAIAQHLSQTTKNWNIHNETQQGVTQQEQTWQHEWQKHKQYHSTKNPTKQQAEQIQQHNYMQYSNKKTQSIAKKLFHKKEEAPEKEELSKTEKCLIGNLFLKTHEIQEQNQENNKKKNAQHAKEHI